MMMMHSISLKRLLWTVGVLLSRSKAFHVAPRSRISILDPKRSLFELSMVSASPSASSSNQKTSFKKTTPSDRMIVTLGRRGLTDEALQIYSSIERPTVRQMNGAIDACSRARPTRLDQAFTILEEGIKRNGLKPNVFTFGALMSACSRARRADRALQVLRDMQQVYHVEPNNVVYSSTITACARSQPTPLYMKALDLLEEATLTKGLVMNVVGYNAALSACARAGEWKAAIQLLQKMETSTSPQVPKPDTVTYGTILSACELGNQWELVLKYTNYLQGQNMPLDGLAITSALHACQRLGMASEALHYLELMKTSAAQSKRKTAGWQREGVRSPLQGPDAVAYRLAISACARGGRWEDGIQLLEELRMLKEADVVAYTAAITGCEYAGEWKRAFFLLDQMRKDGVEPNHVTMAAVIGACATASANAVKRDYDEKQVKLPKQKALELLQVMKEDASTVDPNIVVYNAAIRACGEALDLDSALKLLEEIQDDDSLESTEVTYGSLMMACERVGSLDGASKVFKKMRAEEIIPNEIIYGAAISCCRKAGNPERALLLLRKMIREELSPNVATFNTVIYAQTEGRKADVQKALLVYKLMKSKYSQATPNRQTYNLLIRALAANREAGASEALLRKMKLEGFAPDVDLYTATVAAYEKNGQPLKALRLMESMQEDGYDFYEIAVLDKAFKKAVKLVNAVAGRGRSSSTAMMNDQDEEEDFGIDINGEIGDSESFIGR